MVVISGSPGIGESFNNPLLHHMVKDFDTREHHSYTEEQPNSLLPEEVPLFLAKMLELHPQHWMPRFCLGGLQAGMGRIDEARASLELAYEMSGGLSRVAATIAMLSYGTGDQARGDELFEMLQQRARK